MKAIGIIAEFNPLHKGHEYFLREARQRAGADAVIVVMSGDFVQRGEPAIWNKYIRAEAALYAGADLVLELPVSFSTASAALFAEGAVSILDDLGVVSELWFGSEAGELAPFVQLADILASEPPDFSESLKAGMKAGMTYPQAKAAALSEYLADHTAAQGTDTEMLPRFLAGPNNILGLEYCIALRKRGSRIQPKTLPRAGSGYHDLSTTGKYPSAGAIRSALARGETTVLSDCMPDFFSARFDPGDLAGQSVLPDDFSLLLHARLLSETAETLASYLDIGSDLAQRIKKAEPYFQRFTQFAQLIKSRNCTYTHISRALLHILLGIRAQDPAAALRQNHVRMLALNDTPLLTPALKAHASRTLCASAACLKEAYAADLFASHLYEAVSASKTGKPFRHEYRHRLIRLT